ncbi:hypothetical protein QBC47DRAFT_362135 [Echria macrotheca]|uniref:Uncharacterized protein n=1 Tax=Echria macrotheca TaxID=438768 RepID=A0AAJ0F435_9PEZI|nr:hypothetical protein QBC47DRAFT_362135 [Echria macrotheca]
MTLKPVLTSIYVFVYRQTHVAFGQSQGEYGTYGSWWKGAKSLCDSQHCRSRDRYCCKYLHLRMPYRTGTKLKYLREDSTHVVYAQRPENIQPQVLSDLLVKEFGEGHFQISLRRGVMVIYIDREEVRKRAEGQRTKVDGDIEEVEDQSVKMETYKRRALDVNRATTSRSFAGARYGGAGHAIHQKYKYFNIRGRRRFWEVLLSSIP